MKTSAWLMLIAGSVALSGCGRSAGTFTSIAYHQIGLCKGYETPSGPVSAGKNMGFAVFQVETVDNTKYENEFVLAPARLFVNQLIPGEGEGSASKWYRRFGKPDPRFAQAMGFTSSPEILIPAGAKVDVHTFVVIPFSINATDGAAGANPFNFELAYDSGDVEAAYDMATGARGSQSQKGINEGIILTKTNPSDTKWEVVENCKELAFK